MVALGHIAAVEEVGADEGVQVAIEDFLDIAALDFSAVVFDELVGLHRVGTNLAAETDFGFGGVEFVERVASFFQFELVELRAQNFHGDFAVLVLATFVLALHHDVRGQVRQPDRAGRFVDVLAAVAAGAESVNAQVVGLDVDFDAIVDFRDDEGGGEGGVATRGLIKRRDTHEAMDTALAGEHAVGVFTFDLDCGGFDAASSPGVESRIVARKPFSSAQRRYMRRSISAQSWDSVPPAPGFTVTMALRLSFSPARRVLVSRSET